jgi:hypothetical protein
MTEKLKRITIQIKPEQYERLHNTVEHGFRRHVLSSLIDLALDAIEANGDVMIGALMTGKYKLVWDDPERPNIGT